MTMALNLKPWPYLCLVVEMHSSLIVYSGKLLIANSIWQACISIHALRESFFLIFSLSFSFLHFSLSLSLPSFFYLLCSFLNFSSLFLSPSLSSSVSHSSPFIIQHCLTELVLRAIFLK